MNLKKLLGVIFTALLIFQTSAIATPETQKIAVVDIQKIVQASPLVKDLQKNQETKQKELADFIKNASLEVNKQTSDQAKKSVAEKYEKQLAKKRDANIKEYASKVKAADESIHSQIAQKAQELGYTMVLPKAAVLYGGDDITEAVLKVIK